MRQDENLRVRLRRVPGCPLVFVSRTVLLMEQPSGKSKAEFEKAEVRLAAAFSFFVFVSVSAGCSAAAVTGRLFASRVLSFLFFCAWFSNIAGGSPHNTSIQCNAVYLIYRNAPQSSGRRRLGRPKKRTGCWRFSRRESERNEREKGG